MSPSSTLNCSFLGRDMRIPFFSTRWPVGKCFALPPTAKGTCLSPRVPPLDQTSIGLFPLGPKGFLPRYLDQYTVFRYVLPIYQDASFLSSLLLPQDSYPYFLQVSPSTDTPHTLPVDLPQEGSSVPNSPAGVCCKVRTPSRFYFFPLTLSYWELHNSVLPPDCTRPKTNFPPVKKFSFFVRRMSVMHL